MCCAALVQTVSKRSTHYCAVHLGLLQQWLQHSGSCNTTQQYSSTLIEYLETRSRKKSISVHTPQITTVK